MLDLKFLDNISFIKNILNDLSLKKEISLSGFSIGEMSLLIKSYLKENSRAICIMPDLISANNIFNSLNEFEINCELINENFNYLEKNNEKNKKISLKIANKLNNYLLKNNSVLIFTPNSLNLTVNNLDSGYKIEQGSEIARDFVINKLISLGFTRVFENPENLEFSCLGDIIKINQNNENVLIDFFGDFVEELKINGEKVKEINLYNFNYNFFDAENSLINILSESEELTFFISNPKQIEDELFYIEVEEENNKIKRNKFFLKNNFFSKIKQINKKIVCFNEFYDVNTINHFQNQMVGMRKYLYDYKSLNSDISYYSKNNFNVVLFCGSDSSKDSLKNLLCKTSLILDFEKENNFSQGIYISNKNISNSFSFLQDKIVVIGVEDLIKTNKSKLKAITKKSIYLPKVGDYVVHEIHGIGKCIQIERLRILNHEKDYVVVEYRNGDKLYVPSEQLNLLSAYVGSDEQPKLNLIGGLEFGKQKEKVKNSIKKLTIDLLKIYSERENKKGFVYIKNDYLYDEFVRSFPYEETEDQLKAEKEILSDMESNKILDRLVCGDVGYGKTEVALRAAYKAVLSGKQVAFLCPTTVLSQQHYNTCKERFQNFMVNVEVLNRFKSKSEVDKILADLKEGKIDILCGTHKLLGKNVVFKDLSLLILDEEQKFGVEHKEKIKSIKNNIDILSLSATPIPRTLQMSLSGIRDISLIETPPKNRLPVQTYVTEISEKLIVDACEKELNRNGQVFIIYNEIKTIDSFAHKVSELLPNARIGVAHGAMNEKILQETINKMYAGEFDIIIATTLIENGIDNPFANTLIVVDADKLGLSELYQLRGRVGRSDRLAFAYFTYMPQKVLTETAYKRLEALAQFTELGSGFKIAMKDLEIRGAGDLLGKEQHGHLSKVGFDLYNKLIQESIDEIKGKSVEHYKEIKLEVDLDAFISANYIKEESDRIEVYSKISEIKDSLSAENLVKELYGTYGELPEALNNLIKIGLLKNLAQKNYVQKIVLNKNIKKFILYKQEQIVTDKISNSLKIFDKTSLKFGQLLEIVFENSLPLQENLNIMIKFLS